MTTTTSISTPTSTATSRRTTSRGNLLAAALVVGLGTLVLGAQPADAGNEFKHAFKDEFGRIVAHQVAAVSSAVLFGPVDLNRVSSTRRGTPFAMASSGTSVRE